MKEKKLLNFFDIFSIAFGGAVGSGIFVMLGIGIGFTGRSVSIAVLLGAFVMLLAYIYNIFMVSMFPLKGGTYSQNAMLLTPTFTGVNATMLLLSACTMSIYSTSMVTYLGSILPGILPYTKIISVAIMTLFFATTIKGSKFIAVLQNIMTVVLILCIALFIVFGLPHVKGGFFTAPGFFKSGMSGFYSATALMGFACMGATGSISLTATTKRPKKTIPGAIFAATIALGVMYFFMAVVAAGVLPVKQVAGQGLSMVSKVIFPSGLYQFFIVGGAVFGLATSLLAMIAGLRYPISQMAEDGWLPKVFTKKTESGYPWATQLGFYLISIIPIIFGFDFNSLVSLIMIPLMLITTYCNVKCISIPKQYPKQWKASMLHMPMPVFKVIMFLGIVADIFVAYNDFVSCTPKVMVKILIVLLVLVAYAVLRLKTKAVDVDKILALKKAVIDEAADEAANL